MAHTAIKHRVLSLQLVHRGQQEGGGSVDSGIVYESSCSHGPSEIKLDATSVASPRNTHHHIPKSNIMIITRSPASNSNEEANLDRRKANATGWLRRLLRWSPVVQPEDKLSPHCETQSGRECMYCRRGAALVGVDAPHPASRWRRSTQRPKHRSMLPCNLDAGIGANESDRTYLGRWLLSRWPAL